MTKMLVFFQNKQIRRTWFNEEWWFVAIDIVEALTDSKDPSGYLKDMRRRDEGFKEGWGKLPHPLRYLPLEVFKELIVYLQKVLLD